MVVWMHSFVQFGVTNHFFRWQFSLVNYPTTAFAWLPEGLSHSSFHMYRWFFNFFACCCYWRFFASRYPQPAVRYSLKTLRLHSNFPALYCKMHRAG